MDLVYTQQYMRIDIHSLGTHLLTQQGHYRPVLFHNSEFDDTRCSEHSGYPSHLFLFYSVSSTGSLPIGIAFLNLSESKRTPKSSRPQQRYFVTRSRNGTPIAVRPHLTLKTIVSRA